jgi:hypothetical protein
VVGTETADSSRAASRRFGMTRCVGVFNIDGFRSDFDKHRGKKDPPFVCYRRAQNKQVILRIG